jgi:hypothetical protein
VDCDACGSAPRAERRFCIHSGARLDASAGASVAITELVPPRGGSLRSLSAGPDRPAGVWDGRPTQKFRGDGLAAGLMNVPAHPPTEVVPNVPSAQVVRSPPSSAFGESSWGRPSSRSKHRVSVNGDQL